MKFYNYMTEKEDNSDDKLKLKIMKFFKENPNPEDSQIHKFSEKENIDTHEFEGIIYSILSSFLAHGRAKEKNITAEDVDPKELEMGINVEMEHTNNKKISERIALDHLAEIDDYYTRLKKMESDAGVEH